MLSKCDKGTTLMVLIDAFSKAYFSKKYTPFLHGLAEEGIVTHVEPLFAFRGIETTIFTGVWPNVHNVWTEFCLAQNLINSKKDRLLQQVIRPIDLLPNDEFRAKLRYFIERCIFKKFYKTLNLVPADAMPYFIPSQAKGITEAGVIGNITTLFDVFRRRGVKFVFIEPWISGDWGVFRKTIRIINQNYKCRFWYLKFSRLDRLGHKFGPKPSAFRDQLTKIDMYVEQIVTLLLKKNSNLKVVILADHGMSQVHEAVNALEDIGQLKSQMYKDYIAFADSMMLRFWFFTKEAKYEISDYLSQIKCGHTLTTREKRLLKIPLDPKYGETIYVVNEGYVIHPCFFHSKFIVKGMHGYAYPKTSEALPILITNGEIAKTFHINKQVTYIDILQLVLRSLGYL